MTRTARFLDTGWCKFECDPGILKWASAASTRSDAAIADPANAQWFRAGSTWFVGVNALENNSRGALDGLPLSGPAIDFVTSEMPGFAQWDQAQISVIYPGYPKQDAGETDAAFRFRRDRAAAHVDGLHRVGPNNRRQLREYHAFILGIPLNVADFSPVVVWEGSHEIMRRTFSAALDNLAPGKWGDVDLTDVYTAARRKVFQNCPMVAIRAKSMLSTALRCTAYCHGTPGPLRHIETSPIFALTFKGRCKIGFMRHSLGVAYLGMVLTGQTGDP